MMGLLRQFTLNKWKVKSPKVKFGLLTRIGDGTTFEGHNSIGRLTSLWGWVGKYSYLGDNCLFMGHVGRYTSISSNVHTINGRHALKAPYVSTCPLFYSTHNLFGERWVSESKFDEYVFADKEKRAVVVVGSDCWIGFGASIIEGITIGDGAVVLANATVTKDVPPYAIVGGVPAKVIGYRYDESTIEKLLAMKWWNRDEDWIRKNVQSFCDLESFLKLV